MIETNSTAGQALFAEVPDIEIEIQDFKGPKGDKGDTPQKGIDYYTEADRQEMVHAVADLVGPTYHAELNEVADRVTVLENNPYDDTALQYEVGRKVDTQTFEVTVLDINEKIDNLDDTKVNKIDLPKPYDDTAIRSELNKKLNVSTYETHEAAVDQAMTTALAAKAEKTALETEVTRAKAAEKTLSDTLAGKQDKLTAGVNIRIDGNVISATGGGSGGEAYDDTEIREELAQKVDGLTFGQAMSSLAGSLASVSSEKANKSEVEAINDRVTAVENAGYLTSVPVAATGVAGAVKPANYLNTIADGSVYAGPISAQTYPTASNNSFIGKGTLTNVLSNPSIMPALTEEGQKAARERIGVDLDSLKNDLTDLADSIPTDEHINALINSALGAIEDAYY